MPQSGRASKPVATSMLGFVGSRPIRTRDYFAISLPAPHNILEISLSVTVPYFDWPAQPFPTISLTRALLGIRRCHRP